MLAVADSTRTDPIVTADPAVCDDLHHEVSVGRLAIREGFGLLIGGEPLGLCGIDTTDHEIRYV